MNTQIANNTTVELFGGFGIFPKDLWCEIFQYLNINYWVFFKCLSKDFLELARHVVIKEEGKKENQNLKPKQRMEIFCRFIDDFVDVKFSIFSTKKEELVPCNSQGNLFHSFMEEFHLNRFQDKNGKIKGLFFTSLIRANCVKILSYLYDKNLVSFTKEHSQIAVKESNTITLEWLHSKAKVHFEPRFFYFALNRCDLSVIRWMYKKNIVYDHWSKEITSFFRAKNWEELVTWAFDEIGLLLTPFSLKMVVNSNNIPLFRLLYKKFPLLIKQNFDPQLFHAAAFAGNIPVMGLIVKVLKLDNTSCYWKDLNLMTSFKTLKWMYENIGSFPPEFCKSQIITKFSGDQLQWLINAFAHSNCERCEQIRKSINARKEKEKRLLEERNAVVNEKEKKQKNQ